jgi:hypothetical protein
LYEAWLESVLEDLGLNSHATLKGLQYPLTNNSGRQTGYSVTLAKIQSSNAVGSIFKSALRKHRKNAFASVQALLQCYRFFKRCRDDLAHGGGRASEKTLLAYSDFAPLTNSDLALEEKPEAVQPVLGDRLALTLRGVVGFTDVVLRLIATFDAELAMCPRAEDEIVNRWRANYGKRIQLKADPTARDKQVIHCLRKIGLPEPDTAKPLIKLLRDHSLVKW